MTTKVSLLSERSGDGLKYGCAMLYFDFPKLREIQKHIKIKDIYSPSTHGLDREPHTTLLYGVHLDVPVEKVASTVSSYSYSTCVGSNVSLFENEYYDVLKFEVEGENLEKCHYALRKLPSTVTFPDYNPHLTIGYLKPGRGKQYVQLMKGLEYELKPMYVVYSLSKEYKSKKYKIEVEINE